MSVSIGLLGINNPPLVQGFDIDNTHVGLGLSKIKKLQSHFLSSQNSWQATKYEVPVDPIIFNMCNDYMCSTTKKKLDMGSKFSQISCGVPSVHYEIKKPAVNIIGGYVGAKSQQNRENQCAFAIHEILADLLPDILSETSQRTKDFPEFQPEKNFVEKADFKVDAEICLQNFTVHLEEEVNLPMLMGSKAFPSNTCPSKGTREEFGYCQGTFQNVLPKANANTSLPTYASVASTPASPLKLHDTTAKNNDKMNKSLKDSNACRGRNYRKNKRKRKRKSNKANCSDANELKTVNAESSAYLVGLVSDEHFPSLCEETTLQEPLMSDIVQDVSTALVTRVDDIISQCADLQSDYLCSYDEVDSPHSTNYSCSPQEKLAHAKGNNFVCQNKSIAFIMNGNDELSDTDSDWSCENKDSFHDEVWDSFREDFECFQNFFVFESIYPNGTNVGLDKDGDCELQDEELCVYINQFENDSELCAGEILAARLKEVNQRWDSAMKDVAPVGRKTKVQFAPDNYLVEVHIFERSLEEIPSESWEHYQLDRCRFRNRVKELETIISPCLDKLHRQKVWDILSCNTEPLEASTLEY